MPTLKATLRIAIDAMLEDQVDIGTVAHEVAYTPNLALSNGTGLNQANQMFSDQRTLAASANESLDLAGTLLNAFGNTITFTKIRAILIRAAVTNTNNVLVGGAASNGWVTWCGAATDTIVVRPGGFMLLAAPDATGYTVTAATGDLLKIANSAGGSTVTYDIVIIGA